MHTYILRRLLLMIPSFFIITAISFFIMQLAPGGPLEAKMRRGGGDGEISSKSTVTAEAKEALIKLYGFDKPLYVQYGLWVWKIIRLDFGESLFEYRPVKEIFLEKTKVALLFGISSTIVSYFVCILLGIFKAIRKDSFFDRITTIITFMAYSIPTMIVAIGLIVAFGVKLNWFPIIGLYSDDFERLGFWEQIIDVLYHFILPFICFVIGSFAFLTELQKKSMLEELGKDYIRTARAKGLSEHTVYFKHALRNALIPIVTSLRSVLISFLGASFIVESIFTIPGLGYLGYHALLVRDYPIIMANLTLTAILGMLSTLLADFLYTLVDPRIDFS